MNDINTTVTFKDGSTATIIDKEILDNDIVYYQLVTPAGNVFHLTEHEVYMNSQE